MSGHIEYSKKKNANSLECSGNVVAVALENVNEMIASRWGVHVSANPFDVLSNGESGRILRGESSHAAKDMRQAWNEEAHNYNGCPTSSKEASFTAIQQIPIYCGYHWR